MAYNILTARMNLYGDAVVLRTSDAGEVHLDLTMAPDHPHVNNREARASYEAWLLAGNTPEAYVADPVEAARAARKGVLDAEATTDAFIDRLRASTPDQIKTFVTDNVTDLASARALLGRLAVAVAYVLNGGSAK